MGTDVLWTEEEDPQSLSSCPFPGLHHFPAGGSMGKGGWGKGGVRGQKGILCFEKDCL